MEDGSNHLGAVERELSLQCQSLNDIHNQLMTLIALSGGVNPHVEAPPAVTNAVVAPLNPLGTTTHQLKPVTPSEFLRDHMRGHWIGTTGYLIQRKDPTVDLSVAVVPQ